MLPEEGAIITQPPLLLVLLLPMLSPCPPSKLPLWLPPPYPDAEAAEDGPEPDPPLPPEADELWRLPIARPAPGLRVKPAEEGDTPAIADTPPPPEDGEKPPLLPPLEPIIIKPLEEPTP